MKIKHFFLFLWLVVGFRSATAQSASLRQQFVYSPAREARPWTFWHWMPGAMTPETITADLQTMRRAGLGGACLTFAPFPSEGWRLVTHSMKEADRLEMQLGMRIGDDFALGEESWITPPESMQKVVWSDTIISGGNIRNLRLPAPEAFEGYYEEIATYAVPLQQEPEEVVAQDELIALPLYQGRLTARLPEGKWRILRMGHTSTGYANATDGEDKRLRCDKFSLETVQKQCSRWFAELFKKTDEAVARRVLKYIHVEDWDSDGQNWSEDFATEFKVRRGYDLMPYLPLLAGVRIESADRSEQVLQDIRTTIGELTDEVLGTVWADCTRLYDCRFFAKGLTHDFTEITGVWDKDLARLKLQADRDCVSGVNDFFFHYYTHNSWRDSLSGVPLDGIGIFFQRDETWWEEGKAFVDYIARCRTLLQYGRQVADTIPQLPCREQDVLLPADVAYTHRSGDEYEIYFIANGADSLRTFHASFREKGRMPELWNAVTGGILRPAQWKEADNRTEITLSLFANGSVFVVFPKEYSEVPREETDKEPLSVSVEEWTVTFPSVRQAVTRSALFDWSREEDEKIKYYSGRAVYKGLFSWKSDKEERRIILRLGKVANMATVRVNSIPCGTAWTAPYEIDITDALRDGTNVLEVDVVNTWANALHGTGTNDESLQPEELSPAGWLGPYEFFRYKSNP